MCSFKMNQYCVQPELTKMDQFYTLSENVLIMRVTSLYLDSFISKFFNSEIILFQTETLYKCN